MEDRLFRRGGNAATPVIQAGQPRESPDIEILPEVLFSYQFYDVRLVGLHFAETLKIQGALVRHAVLCRSNGDHPTNAVLGRVGDARA